LGKEGICVWDGDFYAARTVQVLGLNNRGGLLRTGMSMYNSREEVQRLLAGIGKFI
jgi:selenocysteine lyase/cysteine desulfurase